MNELLEKLKTENKTRLASVLLGVAILLLLLWAMIARVIVPGNRYAQAEKLMLAGRFQEAAAAFDALGEYSNAQDRSREARYAQAEELMHQGRFEEAISAFKAMGDYADAQEIGRAHV